MSSIYVYGKVVGGSARCDKGGSRVVDLSNPKISCGVPNASDSTGGAVKHQGGEFVTVSYLLGSHRAARFNE